MKVTELFNKFSCQFGIIQYAVATNENDIDIIARGTGDLVIINNDPFGLVDSFDCDYDEELANKWLLEYGDYIVDDWYYEFDENKIWLCIRRWNNE